MDFYTSLYLNTISEANLNGVDIQTPHGQAVINFKKTFFEIDLSIAILSMYVT